MVMGAKDGHNSLYSWVRGEGQAPVADSSDAAAPSLSEWKVDGATGVAS